jgi:hypothetical protein
MMTVSRCPRGGCDRSLRTVPHVVAAGAAVIAMVIALGAGPAAYASARGSHPPRASSSDPRRGWVKHFIVAPPEHGHKEFLFQIAAQVLGNGNRYTEIFILNKDRLQPDGARLEAPTVTAAATIRNGRRRHWRPPPSGRSTPRKALGVFAQFRDAFEHGPRGWFRATAQPACRGNGDAALEAVLDDRADLSLIVQRL